MRHIILYGLFELGFQWAQTTARGKSPELKAVEELKLLVTSQQTAIKNLSAELAEFKKNELR